MEQAVEKSEQLVVLFWPIVPRGIFGRIIKRNKSEQPIAQISENGNGDISEIETITETIEYSFVYSLDLLAREKNKIYSRASNFLLARRQWLGTCE